MTSAEGYECFWGTDPEGSPPEQLKQGSLELYIREREGTGATCQWCWSQVTYDEASANMLAQEVAEQSEGSAVACLLCPDVFLALKRSAPDVEALLLDFDPTYSQSSGAFAVYDPKQPEVLPPALHQRFEVVIADTSALGKEEESALRILRSMQLLSKSLTHPKLFLLTDILLKAEAWSDVGFRACKFKPRRKAVPHTGCVLYASPGCKPSHRLDG